jgi:VCBS repeat-containing protein
MPQVSDGAYRLSADFNGDGRIGRAENFSGTRDELIQLRATVQRNLDLANADLISIPKEIAGQVTAVKVTVLSAITQTAVAAATLAVDFGNPVASKYAHTIEALWDHVKPKLEYLRDLNAADATFASNLYATFKEIIRDGKYILLDSQRVIENVGRAQDVYEAAESLYKAWSTFLPDLKGYSQTISNWQKLELSAQLAHDTLPRTLDKIDALLANVPPVIHSGVFTGDVFEDGVLQATGSISFADPNPNDTHTITLAQSAGTHGTLNWSVNAGLIQWTYNANPEAIEPLDDDDIEIDTFTFKITDALGASVTQEINVNVHGADQINPPPPPPPGSTTYILNAWVDPIIFDRNGDGVYEEWATAHRLSFFTYDLGDILHAPYDMNYDADEEELTVFGPFATAGGVTDRLWELNAFEWEGGEPGEMPEGTYLADADDVFGALSGEADQPATGAYLAVLLDTYTYHLDHGDPDIIGDDNYFVTLVSTETVGYTSFLGTGPMADGVQASPPQFITVNGTDRVFTEHVLRTDVRPWFDDISVLAVGQPAASADEFLNLL